MVVLIAFLAKNVPCAKKISSSLIPSQRLRQINDCATTPARHDGMADLIFAEGLSQFGLFLRIREQERKTSRILFCCPTGR